MTLQLNHCRQLDSRHINACCHPKLAVLLLWAGIAWYCVTNGFFSCLNVQPSAVGNTPCSHFRFSGESCTIREKWWNLCLRSIFTYFSWSGWDCAPTARLCVPLLYAQTHIGLLTVQQYRCFHVILLMPFVINTYLTVGSFFNKVIQVPLTVILIPMECFIWKPLCLKAFSCKKCHHCTATSVKYTTLNFTTPLFEWLVVAPAIGQSHVALHQRVVVVTVFQQNYRNRNFFLVLVTIQVPFLLCTFLD